MCESESVCERESVCVCECVRVSQAGRMCVEQGARGGEGSRCERADGAAASLAPADARDRRGGGVWGVRNVAGRLSDR